MTDQTTQGTQPPMSDTEKDFEVGKEVTAQLKSLPKERQERRDTILRFRRLFRTLLETARGRFNAFL